MTARPSITRQAPAKKRNRSELTAISSTATPTGLPVWLDSSRPSSSAFASRMSAILSNARLRAWGVVRLQVSKAASAASTARLTSSWPEAGTCATTSYVAGFSTARVSPDTESTHWPPMNCWYVLTGFRVSVTRASKGRTSWRIWPRVEDVSADCAPTVAAGSSEDRPMRRVGIQSGLAATRWACHDCPTGVRFRALARPATIRGGPASARYSCPIPSHRHHGDRRPGNHHRPSGGHDGARTSRRAGHGRRPAARGQRLPWQPATPEWLERPGRSHQRRWRRVPRHAYRGPSSDESEHRGGLGRRPDRGQPAPVGPVP